MQQDVFLHGQGLLSGLGDSLDEALQTLMQRHSMVDVALLPDGSTRPYFQIKNPQQHGWLSRIEHTVVQAVEQANASHLKHAPLIIASSCINIGQIEETNTFPESCLSFAEHIKQVLSWQGAVYLIPVACTASMQAILLAQRLIQSGQSQDVLVLGVELLNRATVFGFAAMGLLSETFARPLGQNRDGMVLGEAVAALHLSAAPSRWQLLGGASMVSGVDPTGAVPEAVHTVCEKALAKSGLAADQIDLLKLQASGSPHNDANELEGVSQAFLSLPALVTLKHMLGHTLGASGMAEIMLLLSMLESGLWPEYDGVLDEALPHAQHLYDCPQVVTHIMAMILGFGGEHAALVIRDNTDRGDMGDEQDT